MDILPALKDMLQVVLIVLTIMAVFLGIILKTLQIFTTSWGKRR